MVTDHIKGKWLYLPIEIKVRELDAKLLLAYYAVKENFRVLIGEHKMVERAASLYPKGIFFSKGYPHTYREKIIINAIKQGHKIVELDEEGLIIPDKTIYLSDRMTAGLLKDVNQEYCWGYFQKEVIDTAYPARKDQHHVIGNPRFDLLREKYRLLYKDEADRLQKKYGVFILINTRFTKYNHHQGIKKKNIVNDCDSIKKLYHHFIVMIKSLARKFPTMNIVIRPHPGERMTSYQQAFSNIKNIHVIHEGNVINWLLAAKIIIHNGCTTGIEAFLLEKPVIAYVPFDYEKEEANMPNMLSKKAYSLAEVCNVIEATMTNHSINQIENQNQIAQSKEYFSYYYGALTGRYAYEKIIQLLTTIQIHNEHSHIKAIPFSNRNIHNIGHRFPSLTLEEISAFVSKIDQIEKTPIKIIIEKVAENVFQLST